MNILPRKKFFNRKEETQIISSIQEAEKNTSGEIKVHVESRVKGEVFDRALKVFEELELHRTQLRNGVLFYLAMKDKKFAIIGDEGINQVVPDNFWDEIKEKMRSFFKDHKFADGLSQGIQMSGEQLKKHFPYQSDDVNEISDDISTGE